MTLATLCTYEALALFGPQKFSAQNPKKHWTVNLKPFNQTAPDLRPASLIAKASFVWMRQFPSASLFETPSLAFRTSAFGG